MGNFSSMDISASGLSAQRQRMDVIASNIANADTTRTPAGGPYRRLHVALSAGTDDVDPNAVEPLGVEGSQIVADSTPPKMVYNPGHPDANAQGYVAMPNVNIVEEMVDMISANRAYEANVTALSDAKAMAMKSLEIGRG